MVFVLVLAACPQRLDGREQAAFRQQHAAGDAGLNRCYAGGFAGSTDLTATRARSGIVTLLSKCHNPDCRFLSGL